MNRKNIELDQLATSIDNYRDNTKMYQAVKTLKRKPIQNATVHDNKGRTITEPTEIYKTIREHFQTHFNEDKARDIEPFNEPPKPLTKPITTAEVSQSIKRLHNNRAPGYDNIRPKLLKYGPHKLNEEITDSINNMNI